MEIAIPIIFIVFIILVVVIEPLVDEILDKEITKKIEGTSEMRRNKIKGNNNIICNGNLNTKGDRKNGKSR